MTTVILVRHGFSLANKQGIFAGHTDIDLSDIGYLQASLTSEYILNNFNVDEIFSSDLMRAYNTIKPVATALGKTINFTKEFREIFAGDWEGLSFEDIKNKFPTEYNEWMQNTGFARCNNGESMQELQNRAYGKLFELAKNNDGKTILIATHAGVMRAIECAIRNVPLADMKLVGWVANASVSVITFNGEKFNIDVWGHHAHLANLKTDVPTNI